MTSHSIAKISERIRARKMAMSLEMEEMREEIEGLSAQNARLKETRAAVVKGCEEGKLTLIRDALKLSESSEEPDPVLNFRPSNSAPPLGFTPEVTTQRKNVNEF